MIKLCDLVGYKNRKIYQDTDSFCFGVDSVLLSNFVTLNTSCKKILDIGTGTGVIPLIISLRTNAVIDAVEIQKDMYDISLKSISYNKLEGQINLVNDDINNYYNSVLPSIYDVIISNTPYYLSNNENSKKSISRNEEKLSVEDVLIVSRKLLKDGGRISIVYRSNNFIDVIDLFKKYGIEPKKIRFVYDDIDHDSKIFLIEGIKNGKVGLNVMRPLFLKDKGDYSLEYKKIMEGDFKNESEEL